MLYCQDFIIHTILTFFCASSRDLESIPDSKGTSSNWKALIMFLMRSPPNTRNRLSSCGGQLQSQIHEKLATKNVKCSLQCTGLPRATPWSIWYYNCHHPTYRTEQWVLVPSELITCESGSSQFSPRKLFHHQQWCSRKGAW